MRNFGSLIQTVALTTLVVSLGSFQAKAEDESDVRENFYRQQVQREFFRKSLPSSSSTQVPNVQKTSKVRVSPAQTESRLAPVETETTLTENFDDYEYLQKKPKWWNVSAELMSGYSSNVARFEGAPADSFLEVSPELGVNTQLGKRIDVEFGVGAFLRTFNDESVDELFRTFEVNGFGSLTYNFNRGYFWGWTGSTSQFDGREIDFTSPQETGRDSRYSTNRVSTFFGKEWSDVFIEASLGQEFVRAKTTVIDEEGNQFLLDSNESRAGLKVGKEFSRDIRWEGSYNFKFREFLDQRARLENGAVDPNFANAETLDEVEHSLLSSLLLYNLLVEVGYDYTVDQNAGATTRYSPFGNVYLPFKIFKKVNLRAEGGFRYTQYNKFVGEIFENPLATGKRKDILGFYGAELMLDIGKLKPVIMARRTQLESNFNIVEFEEDLISGGFRLNF